MLILGLSCFYHDAAAALIEDGKVIAAAQEERFTRIKHDESFPEQAIKYCLEEAGCTLADLDAVVFYEKPLIKFERIVESYLSVAPKGLRSFVFALPRWIQDKLLFKSYLKKQFKKIGAIEEEKTTFLFTEHHIAHAATAFYLSGFDNAAILTIDGVGEWATTTIGKGEGNRLQLFKEIHFPHSVGMLYSAFTYFLGFKVNSGEYKLMGLSPFGRHKSVEVERYKALIRKEILQPAGEEGNFRLNMKYFAFLYDLKMIEAPLWERLFGMQVRKPEEAIEQHHCDLALAIQEITEELVLDLAGQVKAQTGAEYLCISGGVALNCVANGKLMHSGLFKQIFVPSSPGDSGCAVGAALYAYHHFYGKEVNAGLIKNNRSAYLGPAYSDKEVSRLIRKYKAVARQEISPEVLTEKIARYLHEGQVVGWLQGRMEFGPRALGNRSILASPIADQMQSKLNLKIKFREDFRPFAPVLADEYAQEYFDLLYSANYMEWVVKLKEKYRLALPENFTGLSWKEKLSARRSPLQAVVHADFTARPQTVTKEGNEKLHRLLLAFGQLSGFPVLVNTSFNVRGEPIVCTPEEAYACFMQTDMDVLVINSSIFIKSEQPEDFLKDFQSRNFKDD